MSSVLQVFSMIRSQVSYRTDWSLTLFERRRTYVIRDDGFCLGNNRSLPGYDIPPNNG